MKFHFAWSPTFLDRDENVLYVQSKDINLSDFDDKDVTSNFLTTLEYIFRKWHPGVAEVWIYEIQANSLENKTIRYTITN